MKIHPKFASLPTALSSTNLLSGQNFFNNSLTNFKKASFSNMFSMANINFNNN